MTQSADWLNIRDFGAKIDGKADDTDAIKKAIADCPLGGSVYFPTGRSRVSSALVLNKPITLRGDGTDAHYLGRFGDPYDQIAEAGSIIETPMTDGALIDHTPKAGSWVTPRIIDLHLRGLGDSSRKTVGIKLHSLEQGGYATLRGVRLSNFHVGALIVNTQNSSLDDLWCHGCNTGLILGSAATANTFTNYSASGCGIGIFFDGGACNSFMGGAIQSSLQVGVLVRGEENKLRDIYFESSISERAIDILPSADNTVVDSCHFSGSGHDGVRVGAMWCRILAGKYADTLEILGDWTQVIGPWSGKIIDNIARETAYLGSPLGHPNLPRSSRGVANIPGSKQWVLVDHKLQSTPNPVDVQLTPYLGLGKASYPVVYGTNETQLRIGVDRDPGPAGAKILWKVSLP